MNGKNNIIYHYFINIQENNDIAKILLNRYENNNLFFLIMENYNLNNKDNNNSNKITKKILNLLNKNIRKQI